MEINDIFAIDKEKKLIAVQFNNQDCDEFALAFRNWNDIEYLEDFFETNKEDLQSPFYNNISVEEAISITTQEAIIFEKSVKDVVSNGDFQTNDSLQDLIFQPLHKNDTKCELQESKAYGGNQSWLRLYAIRISPDRFVVAGSAIKLTQSMNERKHTSLQLKKLKITATYLRENDLLSEDDFGYIDFSIN